MQFGFNPFCFVLYFCLLWLVLFQTRVALNPIHRLLASRPSRLKETAAIYSQTVIRLSIHSSIKLNHQRETLLYVSTELLSPREATYKRETWDHFPIIFLFPPVVCSTYLLSKMLDPVMAFWYFYF